MRLGETGRLRSGARDVVGCVACSFACSLAAAWAAGRRGRNRESLLQPAAARDLTPPPQRPRYAHAPTAVPSPACPRCCPSHPFLPGRRSRWCLLPTARAPWRRCSWGRCPSGAQRTLAARCCCCTRSTASCQRQRPSACGSPTPDVAACQRPPGWAARRPARPLGQPTTHTYRHTRHTRLVFRHVFVSLCGLRWRPPLRGAPPGAACPSILSSPRCIRPTAGAVFRWQRASRARAFFLLVCGPVLTKAPARGPLGAT